MEKVITPRKLCPYDLSNCPYPDQECIKRKCQNYMEAVVLCTPGEMKGNHPVEGPEDWQ